jgi:hypothetical protein
MILIIMNAPLLGTLNSLEIRILDLLQAYNACLVLNHKDVLANIIATDILPTVVKGALLNG